MTNDSLCRALASEIAINFELAATAIPQIERIVSQHVGLVGDDLLTPEEAASVLKCSPDTVHKLCAAGRLSALNLGTQGRNVFRIRRSALDELDSIPQAKVTRGRQRRQASCEGGELLAYQKGIAPPTR